MQTPNFQGVHYWNRLQWAKDNLEPFRTEYCVIYEDDMDDLKQEESVKRQTEAIISRKRRKR